MTIDPAVADPSERSADRVVLVVGFDGSEAAGRALDAATRLIAGRVGSIEVVYVAHTPAMTEMSPDAAGEMLEMFDAVEHDLDEAVRTRLAGLGQHWSFRRRDGLIADELVAAADELSRDHSDGTTVGIVIGSAAHRLHHFIGSVPVALVRHARYPIVVVP
jgi:nucleotide-binding universal stress UspA family protein